MHFVDLYDLFSSFSHKKGTILNGFCLYNIKALSLSVQNNIFFLIRWTKISTFVLHKWYKVNYDRIFIPLRDWLVNGLSDFENVVPLSLLSSVLTYSLWWNGFEVGSFFLFIFSEQKPQCGFRDLESFHCTWWVFFQSLRWHSDITEQIGLLPSVWLIYM